MSKKLRLRISFDADTTIERRAVMLAAVMGDKKVNDVMNDLIRKGLPEFVEMAKSTPEGDHAAPRRGRKPATVAT